MNSENEKFNKQTKTRNHVRYICSYRRIFGLSSNYFRAKGTTTLEELHQFFENDPDDHQLETQAEARLKALYHCLVVLIDSNE